MVSNIGSPKRAGSDPCLAIVIVTRNRQTSLLRTLKKLTLLEEEYPIVVVDNASQDNTRKVVQEQFPQVYLLALDKNHGAIARNFGVKWVDQPSVPRCQQPTWSGLE